MIVIYGVIHIFFSKYYSNLNDKLNHFCITLNDFCDSFFNHNLNYFPIEFLKVQSD